MRSKTLSRAAGLCPDSLMKKRCCPWETPANNGQIDGVREGGPPNSGSCRGISEAYRTGVSGQAPFRYRFLPEKSVTSADFPEFRKNPERAARTRRGRG
jgi:hypothetical protein